jgi:hypothetical protein
MVAKVAKKRRNLNATTKVNPPAHSNQPVDLSVRETFHLKFPFELHHMDKTEKKICWFKDKIDMEKYMKKYALKPKDCNILQTKPRT